MSFHRKEEEAPSGHSPCAGENGPDAVPASGRGGQGRTCHDPVSNSVRFVQLLSFERDPGFLADPGSCCAVFTEN